jgi:hypothetical protein
VSSQEAHSITGAGEGRRNLKKRKKSLHQTSSRIDNLRERAFVASAQDSEVVNLRIKQDEALTDCHDDKLNFFF